jgi:hypothetical protein
MAESKAGEARVTKVDSKTVGAAEREGLLTSWVSQSTELAERAVTTGFGLLRDVSNEMNQRVLAVLQLVDNTQQGVIKLARTVDERIDRLTGDSIDTAESLVVGVIRAVRDTGHGVTDLASGLSRPRESARAA